MTRLMSRRIRMLECSSVNHPMGFLLLAAFPERSIWLLHAVVAATSHVPAPASELTFRITGSRSAIVQR